jgi:hypothetical protein
MLVMSETLFKFILFSLFTYAYTLNEYQEIKCVSFVQLVRNIPLSAVWTSSLVAAVGTAWSLLGSHRHGQAALCLLQKHMLGTDDIRDVVTEDFFFCKWRNTHGGACAVFPVVPGYLFTLTGACTLQVTRSLMCKFRSAEIVKLMHIW